MKRQEMYYLFIVTFLYFSYSIGKIIHFPVYIDEAFTYCWFTSKGFSASITYFPTHNNHILFSIITNLFHYLPFNEKINLRLPNLIIGSVCSLSVYLALRKIFEQKVAMLSHSLLTFSYVFLLYTVIARGYMLYISFTFICFWCIYRIIDDPRIINTGSYFQLHPYLLYIPHYHSYIH